MNRNTVATLTASAILAAIYTYAFADELPAKPDRKLTATDIAKAWQPPNTPDSHILGGGDRIAYMRLSVNAPLKDVWQFYAKKIGYKGDKDFSTLSGTDLDPSHVIISDQTRNIILLIHATDDYTVTVQIPKHDGKITKDILVTIATR